jgi:hypothetical protein
MYADAAATNADTHTHGNADCYSHSYTYGHANSNSYTDDNTDPNPHRYSQGNTKTTPKSASSPDSAAIAGLWPSSERLCFSEREDGPQGRGHSIYGFT